MFEIVLLIVVVIYLIAPTTSGRHSDGSNLMSLDNTRVAIVTGASRGLGLAMATGLAKAGFSVVMTGSSDDGAIAGASLAINDAIGHDGTVPMVADVASPEACEALVLRAIDRFGTLDILVNNAGRGMRYVSEQFLTEPTRFWQVRPETWRMVIDTNVNGPFYMARAAAPHLLSKGWGRIINVSMNRETMRRRGFSPYGPSKAALESETAIWAQDLEGSGVTVNALLPGGATLTGMIPAGTPESIRANLLDPEIVVPPLMWLVSDMSSDVTGKRIIAAEWRQDLHDFENAG